MEKNHQDLHVNKLFFMLNFKHLNFFRAEHVSIIFQPSELLYISYLTKINMNKWRYMELDIFDIYLWIELQCGCFFFGQENLECNLVLFNWAKHG